MCSIRSGTEGIYAEGRTGWRSVTKVLRKEKETQEIVLNGGAGDNVSLGMTIENMIEVLQAHRDGKRIQCKINGKWSDKCDCGEDHPWRFNFGIHEYRVAREPREWWLCNGSLRENFLLVEPGHDTSKCGGEVIKVREVLE